MTEMYNILISFTFLLLTYNPLLSQRKIYSWRIDSSFSSNKKDKRIYDDLLSTGLRLKNGTLEMQYIEAWKPFLKREKNYIQIGNDIVTAKSLKQSIVQQYSTDQSDKTKRLFKRYLKNLDNRNILGKTQSWRRFQDSTFILTSKLPNQNSLTVNIFGTGKITEIKFTSLAFKIPEELPELENAVCSPLHRSRHFDLVDNSLSTLQYKPYRTRPTKNVVLKYELSFDKNSVAYNPIDLEPMLNLINEEGYKVTAAHIKGYSSVEGDSANNSQLHKMRADVLMNILSPMADDLINLQVETEENWDLYRQQLLDINFHLWDSLSNDEVKSLLTNDSIQSSHEALLSKQRKAEVKLYVKKFLSNSEQYDQIVSDYYRQKLLYDRYRAKVMTRSYSHRLDKKSLLFLQSIMGIKAFAVEEIQKGNLDYQQVADLWESSDSKEERLLDFYLIRRCFYKGKGLDGLPIQSIITKAQQEVLEVKDPNTINTSHPNFIKSMQILSMAMRLIDDKILEPNYIFELKYPETIAHAHLRAAKEDFIIENNIEDQHEPIDYRTKSWLISDHGLAYYGLVKSTAGVRFYTDKKGVKRVHTFPRSDFYYQFDLLEFLSINTQMWSELCYTCYDTDLTPEIMHSLFKTLFQVNSRICPDLIYEVALDFHLKYLKRQLKLDIMDSKSWYSYEFIRNYYLRNADKLDQMALEKLKGFLMTFNDFVYYNESINDADKLDQKYFWSLESNIVSK